MLKFLERLIPQLKHKRNELNHASSTVSITINRYQDLSRELQDEINNNHFARYLIYEKKGE